MNIKNGILTGVLALAGLSCFATDKDSLVGHAMPLIAAKTMDGRTIDDAYFAGHITLVSFMYIGCPPCMNEINLLNKLTDEYAANRKVQVLCVARQMKEQMREFNSKGKSTFSATRKALGVDSMRYAIQPACPDAVSKMTMEVSGKDTTITMRSECDLIQNSYNITAYPTTVFVDRKGVIRRIDKGGPGEKNDMEFYNRLKEQIEKLLAE